MPAVSNSSPLILYSAIDRLELLHDIYGDLLIPPAVWQETVEAGAGRAGAAEAEEATWIQRRFPSARAMAFVGFAMLDAGETEAIALAMSLEPGVPIILDDRPARRTAREIGLAVTGSAGILALAKNLGLISAVRPVLAEILDAGLFLGESAVRDLLDNVGER